MKQFQVVRKNETRDLIDDFDDIVEARQFMKKQEYCELVRSADGVVLSVKYGGGTIGDGNFRLQNLETK